MKFHELAQLFDEIEAASGRLHITHILARVFDQATPEEAHVISYLSLGRLRAVYKGTKFNFARKSMVYVLCDVLQIDESLLRASWNELGDLGAVFEQYSDHGDDDRDLQAVYEQLVYFEHISGAGSYKEKRLYLYNLLSSVSSKSAKYIVRIILGKLRLGFSDMTIIDALSWYLVGDKSLHKQIEHAYNICADIGVIAYALKGDGVAGLHEIFMTVGVPVRPAAAERLPDAASIIEKIGPCVAQPKLDGFRLQIHIDRRNQHNVIRFFSRNLLDMSAMFPDVVDALTCISAETIIAEGEAIAYNEETQTYMPFQETMKRRRKYGIEQAMQSYPLHLVLFDVLYYNGASVLEQTHEQRRSILKKALADCSGQTVRLTDELYFDEGDALHAYFLRNVTAGLEGLVVKRPDASYQPGKRNFNWIKLKRQEGGKLKDTIDAVILGYYYGRGRRAAFGIGAFLVGVYDPESDSFQTIAKIGTGMSDDEWRQLKSYCDKHAVSEKPRDVHVHKELYPDVWVSPELVVVVRADEITSSPVHTAGHTPYKAGLALRFPRFVAYRSDKYPREATTVAELHTLYEQQ